MNEPGLNDHALPGDSGQEPCVLVSPGARLAACRRERGLTIEQVASQLNLAPRQVIAIEADDYPSLPGMPIVRGFVRQYAKLLKMDAAPLLVSLGGETVLAHEPIRPRQNLSAPFSEARLPSMSARSGISMKWIAAGAAVLIIGAVAYALNEGVDFAGMSESASSQVKDSLSQMTTSSSSGPVTAETTAAPEAVPAVPEPHNAQPPMEPGTGAAVIPSTQSAAGAQAADAASQAPVIPVPSGAQQGGMTQSPPPVTASTVKPSETAAAGAIGATTVVPAVPANGANTLVVKARQDSWVEIKAAGSGKPVIARIVKAGETETFEVNEPVAVVIGNASGVDAVLRGAPIELKAPGNGNVARLTLK